MGSLYIFTVTRYVRLPPRTYFSPVISKLVPLLFCTISFSAFSSWGIWYCRLKMAVLSKYRSCKLWWWGKLQSLYPSKSYNRHLHFPEKIFAFIYLFRFEWASKLQSGTVISDVPCIWVKIAVPTVSSRRSQVCSWESDWCYRHLCGHLTICSWLEQIIKALPCARLWFFKYSFGQDWRIPESSVISSDSHFVVPSLLLLPLWFLGSQAQAYY